MQQLYSPVALVVDDDVNMAGRVARGFLTETSLGVLQAHNLGTAMDYIQDPSIKIDVLVTDLGFAGKTKDPSRNLKDGLDLIAQLPKYRPELDSYVLSVYGDDPVVQNRAKEDKLPISGWITKLAGEEWPWKRVELSCLVRALQREPQWRQRAREEGIDVRDYASDQMIAERVRDIIIIPRITYLPDELDGFEVYRPIQVLCVPDEHGFRASAPQIGLITEGLGEDVEEAIEALSDLIVSEMQHFQDLDVALVGYAAHVQEMLNYHLRTKAERVTDGEP